MPQKLKNVLSVVINAVNFIRKTAKKHRLFQVFCVEMGAQHSVLLYHTEVRWLSRGLVLSRVFELREEVKMFLTEHGFSEASHFSDDVFISMLAYLSDIFCHLNRFCLSLQTFGVTILDAREKLNALTCKLKVFENRVETCNFANFPNLEEVVNNKNVSVVQEEIRSHLKSLSSAFSDYFTADELSSPNTWIQQPFLAKLDANDDDVTELIELQNSSKSKLQFEVMKLENFWCSQLDSFPTIAKKALKYVLPFVTTYLCEKGFSTLLHLKPKERNRLDASDDMRVALSKKIPRFFLIAEKKQQQKSH